MRIPDRSPARCHGRLAAHRPARRDGRLWRRAGLTLILLQLFAPGKSPAEEIDPPAPGVLHAGAWYTADVLANLSGGLRRGSAYLDYAGIEVEFDAGRAFGLAPLRLFASFAHVNRTTFSDVYSGDAMVVSNIDADRVQHLLEAWVERGFDAGGPASVRFGLYDLNSEFDTTEARGLFLNSACGIGHEIAQTGRAGPSIFPAPGLGVRFAWRPAGRWLIKLALLDGLPGPAGTAGRPRWHLSTSEGALGVAETTFFATPGTVVSLGHWRYTGAYADLRPAFAEAAEPGRYDNRGTYVAAEYAPAREGVDPPLRFFLRAGKANGRINAFDRHVALGLTVATGGPTRWGGWLGLAASEARRGPSRAGAEPPDRRPRSGRERNLELTWRLPLSDHVVLQPDLQYVVNPGALGSLEDALVAGLRLEVAIGR